MRVGVDHARHVAVRISVDHAGASPCASACGSEDSLQCVADLGVGKAGARKRERHVIDVVPQSLKEPAHILGRVAEVPQRAVAAA